MAGTSPLVLPDDIAAVLNDVALMTNVAAQKTAGMRVEREIPVIMAVAKGSFKNKLIWVPVALLVNSLAGVVTGLAGWVLVTTGAKFWPIFFR